MHGSPASASGVRDWVPRALGVITTRAEARNAILHFDYMHPVSNDSGCYWINTMVRRLHVDVVDPFSAKRSKHGSPRDPWLTTSQAVPRGPSAADREILPVPADGTGKPSGLALLGSEYR